MCYVLITQTRVHIGIFYNNKDTWADCGRFWMRCSEMDLINFIDSPGNANGLAGLKATVFPWHPWHIGSSNSKQRQVSDAVPRRAVANLQRNGSELEFLGRTYRVPEDFDRLSTRNIWWIRILSKDVELIFPTARYFVKVSSWQCSFWQLGHRGQCGNTKFHGSDCYIKLF